MACSMGENNANRPIRNRRETRQDVTHPTSLPTNPHLTQEDGKVFAGRHLIIELAQGNGFDDPQRIEDALRAAALICNATILHLHCHRFSPSGVSGFAMLAESHISCHTWPDQNYAAFDIFMCGNSQPRLAITVLQDAFDAQIVHVQELHRGAGLLDPDANKV